MVASRQPECSCSPPSNVAVADNSVQAPLLVPSCEIRGRIHPSVRLMWQHPHRVASLVASRGRLVLILEGEFRRQRPVDCASD
jgi:hypothetical protein